MIGTTRIRNVETHGPLKCAGVEIGIVDASDVLKLSFEAGVFDLQEVDPASRGLLFAVFRVH